jgi:hypothetical protein
LFFFSRFVCCEKVHSLQGGSVRIKHRSSRRPGPPVEPAWLFYPKLVIENLRKSARWRNSGSSLFLKYKRILRNPDRQFHMDQALTRVGEVETESRELFTRNETAPRRRPRPQGLAPHRRHPRGGRRVGDAAGGLR